MLVPISCRFKLTATTRTGNACGAQNWRNSTACRNHYLGWKHTDTDHFLTHLKHELMQLPLNGVLGPFLHGYLAGKRFNEVFNVWLVLMPDEKHENYHSFMLIKNDFALVINVAGQPCNISYQNFNCFSNLHTYKSPPNNTQVVNIVPNKDLRINIRTVTFVKIGGQPWLIFEARFGNLC